MPVDPAISSLRLRRWGLCAVFFLPGWAIASWVSRTPAVRDLLGASIAEMGMILLGLSIGSMTGILLSGRLVTRFGTRPIIAVSTAAMAVAMPIVGIAAAAGLAPAVAAGLALFGIGMGLCEVAINIEGSALERVTGGSFLPTLQGWYSLGTLIGALTGMFLTARNLPVLWHLMLVGAAVGIVLTWAIRTVPEGTGRRARSSRPQHASGGRALPRDPRLWAIGFVAMATALAEGTATDWLPLLMVDGHGFGDTIGSAVFALFAATMTVGRFSGAVLVERFGHTRVLAVSAALAAMGMAVVGFTGDPLVVAAVVVWGLGTALGVPVALSAAGRSGDRPEARVALTSAMAYLAFLVGPPVIGLMGDAVGLRAALLVPIVVVAAAVLCTPSAAPGRRTRERPGQVDQTSGTDASPV